jgi:hypothetical protein
VNVTSLSFGGTSTSLISAVGSCHIAISSSNFSSITTTGTSGAVISDASVVSDKTINVMINQSSFTGISTSSAANGVVITVTGGTQSSVIVHNSNFTGGIGTSNSGVTNGGAIYVGAALQVEVDGCTFSGIENVSSGGGLYVGNSGSLYISGSVFGNINVKVAGGMINLKILFYINFYFYFIFFFFLLLFLIIF